jgi:hypothetical protein
VNGRREGVGIQVYLDGSIFEGYFMEDKIGGEGRFLYADGDAYMGE